MSRKPIPMGAMMLLPAAPGTCPACATKHGPDEAHNVYSLFYAVRFQVLYQRSPTWADAVAHLPPEMQAFWKQAVAKTPSITWSEPPAGVDPIVEPVEAEETVTPAPPGTPQNRPTK